MKTKALKNSSNNINLKQVKTMKDRSKDKIVFINKISQESINKTSSFAENFNNQEASSVVRLPKTTTNTS